MFKSSSWMLQNYKSAQGYFEAHAASGYLFDKHMPLWKDLGVGQKRRITDLQITCAFSTKCLLRV